MIKVYLNLFKGNFCFVMVSHLLTVAISLVEILVHRLVLLVV